MAYKFSYAKLRPGYRFIATYGSSRCEWTVLRVEGGRVYARGNEPSWGPRGLKEWFEDDKAFDQYYRKPVLSYPGLTEVVVHKPRHWLVRWTLWWWLGTTYSVIEEQVRGDEDRKKRLKECGWED